jgi:predicted AlkP superfamily phosphohydrolase/phosphomutase
MRNPIIAIGLDAADPAQVDRWMSEGCLPVMAGLRARGVHGRLKTYETYRAETPWTTFLTGATPSQVGYWGCLKYHPDYRVTEVEAYDFQEFKPFYALTPERRVASFDVPHARLCLGVNGIQVTAWGAHSPQAPSESDPPGLLAELIERHGAHPLLRNDGGNPYDAGDLQRVYQGMLTGISRRSQISQDLLRREPWDLFVTVFGEPHVVGHYFWHISDASHPLHAMLAPSYPGDPVRDTFRALDSAIGQIIAAGAPDADVVVFAAHGMGPNVMDLTSVVFLPELLYRFSFPGRQAIAPGRAGDPVPAPICAAELAEHGGWVRDIWQRTRESSALKTWAKQHLPRRIYGRLEPLFGAPPHLDPRSPYSLRERGEVQPAQCTNWFRHLWPQMKAFALPSYSEGYIRINLQGREAAGIVAPSDYTRVCDQLTEMLMRLVDPRSGRPAVKDVVRMRSGPRDDDPNLPDADLVVLWREDTVADTLDSPELGRVGPLAFHRSGSHRADGFLLAAGPGIAQRPIPADAHACDLAPTLLHLLDVPIPGRLTGRPLLARRSG